jgi:uncharacterized UPF0146 family protein
VATARFTPASNQIISDLGQLQLFTNPLKMRILRILQRQEASLPALANAVGEPHDVVARHIDELCDRRIVTIVGGQDGDGTEMYRATALIYNLRPEPAYMTNPAISLTGAMMAAATLDSVTSEVMASLTAWPDQRANYEGRRTRMPYSRALEFNERLVALVDEYWGSAATPKEEDPDDPLLAFVGLWYRFPEEE